eukprot:Hpha_TRINITY_DN15796_c3_g7::TRINITY_DN15796_c3_g7_i1::g.37762::m.37762/K15731/CTDSP; carboxy-terminal domain RNA polymerase II polypeptide A small phosphatase
MAYYSSYSPSTQQNSYATSYRGASDYARTGSPQRDYGGASEYAPRTGSPQRDYGASEYPPRTGSPQRDYAARTGSPQRDYGLEYAARSGSAEAAPYGTTSSLGPGGARSASRSAGREVFGGASDVYGSDPYSRYTTAPRTASRTPPQPEETYLGAMPYALGAASYKEALPSDTYGARTGYRSAYASRPSTAPRLTTTNFCEAAAPPQQQTSSPRRQRLRGHSFQKEWQYGDGPVGLRRNPSMVGLPGRHMLPPMAAGDQGKYTIVLDLDETLIYARDGPLYARPGVHEFLDLLGSRAEGVAWTAGVRAYAQAVLRNIDRKGALKHCVYRHAKWFSGSAGYTKDLGLLGRDLSRTLIVENTPDCVRHYIDNSILLADYERDERTEFSDDQTLPLLHQIVSGLIDSGLTVPQYLARTPLLQKKAVATDVGDYINVNWLDVRGVADSTAGRYNRDLPSYGR